MSPIYGIWAYHVQYWAYAASSVWRKISACLQYY